MISKKLVGNPPQSPIESFHPQTNVYGNVNLGPPKVIHAAQMKHWKDHKTGSPATPVGPANLDRLKKAMGRLYSPAPFVVHIVACLQCRMQLGRLLQALQLDHRDVVKVSPSLF